MVSSKIGWTTSVSSKTPEMVNSENARAFAVSGAIFSLMGGLGQFAADYRRQFGELPSETPERS